MSQPSLKGVIVALALSACGTEPPTVPNPTRGALQVVVRTTGATFDTNGYALQVGSTGVALAVQDSVDLRDLPPGRSRWPCPTWQRTVGSCRSHRV